MAPNDPTTLEGLAALAVCQMDPRWERMGESQRATWLHNSRHGPVYVGALHALRLASDYHTQAGECRITVLREEREALRLDLAHEEALHEEARREGLHACAGAALRLIEEQESITRLTQDRDTWLMYANAHRAELKRVAQELDAAQALVRELVQTLERLQDFYTLNVMVYDRKYGRGATWVHPRELLAVALAKARAALGEPQ